ncbi:MAG: extracellular solute-binding protein, partial [Pseudonocardiales bacterium]|nr:extracellular solute-binding protein [Pseudonocardiales bacterium]
MNGTTKSGLIAVVFPHTCGMSPAGLDDHAEGLIEGILQRGDPGVPPDGQMSEVLTFLVADIRGYTTFTQQRGDEAAEKLTAKFALIVRDLVAQFGGTVFELRGDEALCVFSSPRQSLRLAVALQQRFVEETVDDASLPMTVGIGIDAGEAVRGPDGYRGGALNLAARLCSLAKAGEVLTSPEVAHVARTVDGIRYAVLSRVALKGLAEPIRPVRVFPEGEDPARQLAALVPQFTRAPTPAVRWLPRPLARHPRLTVLGAAVVAVVVAGVLVVVLRPSGGSTGLKALSENQLGIIDPSNGHLIDHVNIDAGPTAIAAGFGSIWTTNTDANTVTQIDAASRQIINTAIPVGVAPSAIAAGPDSMWVTNSGDGTVSRIDPTTTDHPRTIRVGVAPSGVVVAHGSVWVTNAADATVSRIDPDKNEEVQRIPVGSDPSGIGAGRDIWVANSASDTVTQIDGRRHVPVGAPIRVGPGPRGVAVVGDGVWVSYNGSDAIARITTTDASLANPVTVGRHPDQITTIDGHVWTTLQGSGSVVEIDPADSRPVRTVPLGPIPGGIVAAGGRLWVTTTIDPGAHRGGTLRLTGEAPGVDPGYPTGQGGASLLAISYDGLVGFRHSSSADG